MDVRLVTVCSYQSAIQAELAKAALEGEGIPAYVSDDNFVTADWFLGNALGWIKVQVSDSDAQAALAVLMRHPKLTNPHAETPTSEAGSRCLSCGVSMAEESERCASCGWSYLDAGNDDD